MDKSSTIVMARKRGYAIDFSVVDAIHASVVEIAPPNPGASLEPRLASVLQCCAGTLVGQLSTVWLKLAGEEEISDAIGEISGLRGMELGLFVSCGTSNSHDPSNTLPLRLVDAVDRAARDGQIWHPLNQLLVPARPGAIYLW